MVGGAGPGGGARGLHGCRTATVGGIEMHARRGVLGLAQLLDVVNREPLHKTVVGPELDEVKAQIRSFLDRTR